MLDSRGGSAGGWWEWKARYAAYRLGDWAFIALLLLSYVVLYFVQPRHRVITDWNDPALRYPLQEQTVSAAMLFLFAVGLPLLVFAVFFFLRRQLSHTRAELQNCLLAFCLCVLVTLITTDCIKKLCGRPRPNFLELANVDPVTHAPRASDSDVREAYQAFVSGHSSLSFAGLLFLAQFLFQQLSPLSPLHIAQSLTVDRLSLQQLSRINNMPSLFIPALPLALALWISLTRIMDYWSVEEEEAEAQLSSARPDSPSHLCAVLCRMRRHFCEDVLGGCVLGSFFSYCCFTFCYLERRWTWLSVHPAPGAELLLVASDAEGGGAGGRLAASDSAYSARKQAAADASGDREALSQSLL